MPLHIGSQPDHGFEQPLGLMRDCHRRIEKFLGVLLRIVRDAPGSTLDEEHRRALEAALRYFKNAAPWHTRDEEDSLFPRMRRVDDPRVRETMSKIDTLESDHGVADAMHDEIDQIGGHWLTHGTLSVSQVQRMDHLLEHLQRSYKRHIALEDDVIFPLAEQVLSPASVVAIGREMAQRRGVDPGLPPRRCRHGPTHQPAEDPLSPERSQGQ